MREIALTKGQVTIVDDDEYEALCQHKWQASWCESTKSFYAVRGWRNNYFRIHRVITSATKGLKVDHINGDTLDNRKENLRLVTNRENLQNMQKPKSSKYPGVSWNKSRNKWESRIRAKGISKNLGLYLVEIDAFNAYLSACNLYGFSINHMVSKFKEELA